LRPSRLFFANFAVKGSRRKAHKGQRAKALPAFR